MRTVGVVGGWLGAVLAVSVLAHGHAGGTEFSRKHVRKAAPPAPASEPLRGVLASADGGLPKVRDERPRVLLRAKAWDGPSVEQITTWMDRPEYKAQVGDLSGYPIGRALRYLLLDDKEAGAQAVEMLKKLPAKPTIEGSPTYTGEHLTVVAAVYDWMHDHPGLDLASRAKAVRYFEAWGDYFTKYLSPGVTPFYSRNTGALSGLTAIALAIHGESDKAKGYLEHAYKYLRENAGTIREVEDGATGGATYGLFHQFTDLTHTVAMWRSATDWNAAKWIKENQGDWLHRQMLYQIWITYPNGWYYKDGDIWGGSHTDKHEARMQIDGITGMYRDGIGRAHALDMRKRWARNTYYHSYAWMFYLYNNPDIPPKPLSDLGRTEVFSPKLHGLVCWRDSWKPDATVIHFKCGDNVDHHATYDAGKFMIFKHAPLAIKNGHYRGYKSSKHWYYKSPWSANVVIFDSPQKHGYQPFVDFDRSTSWTTWKARRDTAYKHPPTGVLLETEANETYARALGDLTGSTYPTGSTWLRELVFLGYKYLLVLDRVKPGAGVTTRWLLHSINEPEVNVTRKLTIIDNGTGRLLVKTLLPADATVRQVGGAGKAFVHKDRKGAERSWPFYRAKKGGTQLGAGRLDVVPADPSAECLYLHVLFPTDTATTAMPDCAVERKGADLVVTVGNLTYTFKPPRSR